MYLKNIFFWKIKRKYIKIVSFRSLVYNGAKVYFIQNFLNVIVHVIIIHQWNQTARLYEIQVTVICSRAILVAVTSVQCKEGYL